MESRHRLRPPYDPPAPPKDAEQNRRRQWRGFAAALVAVLVAGLLTVTGTNAAFAATGDFSVELEAPTDVALAETFNYVATLNFEGVDSQNPASGVVLTTTLPEGLTFESVPQGAGQVVASSSYDPATRQLTLTLNDSTQSVLSIAYTVSQIDNQNKYDGMEFTTDITGTGGPSGDVTSEPVTTVVHGDNDYNAYKSATTIVGSDNRTVTYHFNVGTTHPDDGTTFTSWAQEITDTLPAGAQLISSSAPWNGGSWDTASWPTVKWTRTGQYGPSGYALDRSFAQIWLTVYYPDTVAGWEDGARPDPNTAELRTQDANGTWNDGGPVTTQGPAFVPTGGTGVAVKKTENSTVTAGALSHQATIAGSYTGLSTAPDIENLVITDSGASGSANADWYQHFDTNQVVVNFSTGLQALDLPYKFEYQVDGSSTWIEYTGYSIASGSTGERLLLTVQNTGSTGYVSGSDILNLPVGSTLSGWRLTIAPGSDNVPVGSEATVIVNGQPVFRAIDDGVQDTDAPAATAPGTLTNTATAEGGSYSSESTSQFTPVDSVYLTTNINAPTSLSVGGTGKYRAGIVNQNPSETYTDSMMSVVLPCGVQYDPAQTITPVAPTTVGVAAAPAVGSGVTVDATARVTDANGCEQQVVTFTFDEIAPMRPPGTANDRWVELSGWQYDIPVTVLAQAYDPAATSVPAYSYVHSEDPRFLSVADGGTGSTTVPMAGWGGFFGADSHDFDAARNTVAVARDISTINVAGGLLISKLSSASASGPWALTSPVGTDAFWQIFVSDVLPNPVSNTVLFDALPTKATGADFDTVLSGAVTGAPAGATVEYSTDATDATSGTWTTDPTNAIAFRVSIPSITVGQEFTLIVPTTVLGNVEAGMTDTNTVDATGTYNGNSVSFDSNEAAVTVAAAPALSIVKKTNGIDVAAAGDAPVVPKGSDVQWTYEVTNTGNATLEDVTVADAGGPDGGTASDVTVTAPAGFDGTLAAGESVTFTGTGKAIEGLYHNTAVATGTPVDVNGDPLTGVAKPTAQDESWYTGGTVAIGITKQVSAKKDGPWSETVEVASGASVWWKVTVTNTGTSPLTNIVVTDPQAGVEPQTIASLAAGESKVLVFEQKQLMMDVTNVANASVEVGGETVAVSDDASATVIKPPLGSPEDDDPLAFTGANVGWLIALALAMLLAGAVLLIARRRGNKLNRA